MYKSRDLRVKQQGATILRVKKILFISCNGGVDLLSFDKLTKKTEVPILPILFLLETYYFLQPTLREKCPNTELFLVRIFLYSDQ